MKILHVVLASILLVAANAPQLWAADYDVIIRGGMVVDGTGDKPRRADVAINGDRIVKIGLLDRQSADTIIDATGKVVTPGFINMLSWATESLINDGRGLSDVVQGVTLEVFGEGFSMGPFTEQSKVAVQRRFDRSPQPVKIKWDTLGGYLEYLEQKGVSPNVASFIGATTVRMNALGAADKAPNAAELAFMKQQVKTAMEEGAMGVGASLIYAPAFYAKTDELVALAKVASDHGGMYISHMRNEGNQLLEAFEESLTIAKEADIPVEVYHLKAAGKNNWDKMEAFIARLEQARSEGLQVTTDMYTYPAGATGLDAAMPPWVQEGGYEAWAKRLQDPEIRAKVKQEMMEDRDDWDNLYHAAGAEGVLFSYFRNPDLQKYTGWRLDAVAKDMGKSPEETIMDLVVMDGTRVSTIYFLMSEDNLKTKIAQPWMSFGSDAGAYDPEIAKQFGNPHPRSYGNFARVFAKYVRDEQVITLEDAVRKMTSLPASNLKLRDRGVLKEGYFADILVFDPAAVQDHSTFAAPHQLSTGMSHVFVNGGHVIKDGQHTGATPGRVVRGPGWTGWQE